MTSSSRCSETIIGPTESEPTSQFHISWTVPFPGRCRASAGGPEPQDRALPQEYTYCQTWVPFYPYLFRSVLYSQCAQPCTLRRRPRLKMPSVTHLKSSTPTDSYLALPNKSLPTPFTESLGVCVILLQLLCDQQCPTTRQPACEWGESFLWTGSPALF